MEISDSSVSPSTFVNILTLRYDPSIEPKLPKKSWNDFSPSNEYIDSDFVEKSIIQEIEKKLDVEIPKGCSDNVKNKAMEIIKKHGPEILKDISKCHFKTTDQILESLGYDRTDLKLN